MKFLQSYNESLRDKMTPKSEEELKSTMGEERYIVYTKLLDIQELLDKKPFGYIVLNTNADPMFLEVHTELNIFNIAYSNDKYVLYDNLNEYELNTKDDLINKIKKISLSSMNLYVKHKTTDLDTIYKEIEDMKEEIEQLNKNF